MSVFSEWWGKLTLSTDEVTNLRSDRGLFNKIRKEALRGRREISSIHSSESRFEHHAKEGDLKKLEKDEDKEIEDIMTCVNHIFSIMDSSYLELHDQLKYLHSLHEQIHALMKRGLNEKIANEYERKIIEANNRIRNALAVRIDKGKAVYQE